MFRTEDVATIAGATPRQLQWWDERNVLNPVHIGHARHYNEDLLLQACILRHLRDAGFSLQKLRCVQKLLSRELRLPKVSWIATDGMKTLKGFARTTDLADFLSALKRPIVVLDLECFRTKIDDLKARQRARSAAA